MRLLLRAPALHRNTQSNPAQLLLDSPALLVAAGLLWPLRKPFTGGFCASQTCPGSKAKSGLVGLLFGPHPEVQGH